MTTLEKIMDEVEDYGKYKGVLNLGKDDCDNWLPIREIKRIIRTHINEGWILPEQSLPREREYVRVTIWFGDEFIGCYRDGTWFVLGVNGLAEAKVIAWQPTQPYQLKGE